MLLIIMMWSLIVLIPSHSALDKNQQNIRRRYETYVCTKNNFSQVKNKEVVDAVLHLLVGGEFDMELNFVIQVFTITMLMNIIIIITTNYILTIFMAIIIKVQIRFETSTWPNRTLKTSDTCLSYSTTVRKAFR